MKKKKKLVTVLGPTAVGKTKFSAKLAYKFNGQIISADSRQVYIGMDIGTGKDIEDYVVRNKQIRYHLINIISPSEEFSIFDFQRAFSKAITNIFKENSNPFLVGGSGLYLSSVLQNYQLGSVEFSNERFDQLLEYPIDELQGILKKINSRLHNTTDLLDKKRIIRAIIISENEDKSDKIKLPNIDNLVLGITADREIIKQQITKRLKDRLNSGMIEEVQSLLTSGVTHEKLRFFGLEYKFISMFLSSELNYNDMFQKLNSAIHKFAKRQMTWFRKMEKEGVKINWLKNNDFETAESLISEFLHK